MPGSRPADPDIAGGWPPASAAAPTAPDLAFALAAILPSAAAAVTAIGSGPCACAVAPARKPTASSASSARRHAAACRLCKAARWAGVASDKGTVRRRVIAASATTPAASLVLAGNGPGRIRLNYRPSYWYTSESGKATVQRRSVRSTGDFGSPDFHLAPRCIMTKALCQRHGRESTANRTLMGIGPEVRFVTGQSPMVCEQPEPTQSVANRRILD